MKNLSREINSKAISNYSYFKFVLNTFATELSRRLNRYKIVAQVKVICPGPGQY